MVTILKASVVSGAMFFFVACNNSDYTKSPATTESSPATDTSTNKMADTSNVSTGKMATATTSKKKGKITLGTMSANKSTAMKPDKNGVYEMTDVLASFPGGQSALEDYVNDHINYPEKALDNNTEGTTAIQFVVDKDGTIHDAKKIGKKLRDGLDEEAVSMVSNMPKWTPGKVKGKDVKSRVTLPITFKMEE